jgi:hypothetical protein
MYGSMAMVRCAREGVSHHRADGMAMQRIYPQVASYAVVISVPAAILAEGVRLNR